MSSSLGGREAGGEAGEAAEESVGCMVDGGARVTRITWSIRVGIRQY
jgi:hypothetical protein